ncbi:MAG: hypothetical protein ACRDTC_11230 [Pseudonocardiaceae bacterium]
MSHLPHEDDRVIGTGHSPGRDPLRAAGALASLGSVVGVITGVLSESGVGVLIGAGSLGAVSGALGGLITVTLVIPRRGQVPPRQGTGPPPAPRALHWLCLLLPGEEGSAWVAEVRSCLAETPGTGKRLRYLGTYLLRVPQLIWHAWAECLRKRH